MHHEARTSIRGAVGWLSLPDPTPPVGAAGLVLPDGCMDIMWVGGELLACGADTGARAVGPATAARFGIRFAPGHLPRVLGLPASALVDQRAPLAEVLSGGAADQARAATREIEEGRGSIHTLERLARTLGIEEASTGFEDAVARRAELGRPVAAIADELGFGTRQLHRRCLDAFGYGPKVLTRVLRLQRALGLGRQGHRPADVAAESGYADQSHLARDLRTLTDSTWTALVGPASREPGSQPSGA